MLSERDRSVISTYVRTNMSLEVLIKSFPQFDRSDIEEIYNMEKKNNQSSDEITISINCS